MKIWIAGSVAARGEEENIRELVKTFNYFDGSFFNVNYNNPSTFEPEWYETWELLNSLRKEGKVVYSPWLKRHDWAMNAFLHMVPIGDWFLAIDAQELPKIEFLQEMRDFVKGCNLSEITSIWWNRPYLIKKTAGMQYVNNPHCWPTNLGPKYINIADESKVVYDKGGVHFGDFIYNKKKRENTLLLSAVKYSLYDPPNNQFEMFYKGMELAEHEQRRRDFCDLLKGYGYSLDLKGLEEFFSHNFNITKNVINYLNYEFVFRDFYRFKILGHTLDEIISTRYNYKVDEI